jgi:hypothetical protein
MKDLLLVISFVCCCLPSFAQSQDETEMGVFGNGLGDVLIQEKNVAVVGNEIMSEGRRVGTYKWESEVIRNKYLSVICFYKNNGIKTAMAIPGPESYWLILLPENTGKAYRLNTRSEIEQVRVIATRLIEGFYLKAD